jgi:hypothetical protein
LRGILTGITVGPGRGAGGPVALVLLLACLAAYWPAVGGGQIWDDRWAVFANEAFSSPDGLRRIWLSPGDQPQYFPVTYSLFWLQYRLWGTDTTGYHLVNILLHSANSLLFWLLLTRLRLPGALTAALLFAVHPVQVESVAWISELKNVLSGFFFLLSLLAYASPAGARGDQPAAAPPLSPAPGPYLLSLALFTLGMLAKTSAMGFPLLLLVLCWWRRGRLSPRDFLSVVPYAAVTVLLATVVLGREHVDVGVERYRFVMPLLDRLLLSGQVFWFYLGKLLWPADLSFIYHKWAVDPRVWWQWVPLAAVPILLLGLGAACKSWGRGPLAAFLVYGLGLGPFLGLVPFYFTRYSWVADHFQYLACMGPLALAGAAAGRAWRRVRRLLPHPVARRPLTAVLAALLLALPPGFLARRHAQVFRDEGRLWRDVLVKNPRALMARNNLANFLLEEGRKEAAAEQYLALLAADPAYPGGNYNLGNTLADLGDSAGAEAAYRRELARDPGHIESLNNLAVLLAGEERYDDAATLLWLALEKHPGDGGMQRNLSLVLPLVSPGFRRVMEERATSEQGAGPPPVAAPPLPGR